MFLICLATNRSSEMQNKATMKKVLSGLDEAVVSVDEPLA